LEVLFACGLDAVDSFVLDDAAVAVLLSFFAASV
jgi:hypothetical protein